MNKTELTERIAEQSEMNGKQIAEVLNLALDAIQDAVAAGDKVTLPGFGTFEKRERAARTGRNPQTGETVDVPASSVPAFKPGKGFKARVKGE